MFLVQGFFWKVVGAFRTKVNFDGFVETKPEIKDGHVVIDSIPFPEDQITMVTEVEIKGVKPLDLYKVMGVAVRTPVREVVKGTIFDSDFDTMRNRINAIISAERKAKRIIDRDVKMSQVDEIIEFGRAVILSDLRVGNYSMARVSADAVISKLNAVIIEVYDAPTKAQYMQGYRSNSEALLCRVK